MGDIYEDLKEEVMSLKLTDDLQVVAIARIFEGYDGYYRKDIYEPMEKFTREVYEAYLSGSVDLNDINENTFDLDYFNEELMKIVGSMNHAWRFNWSIKHVLTGRGLMWKVYKIYLDDGEFDKLLTRLRLPEDFNELAVRVFDYELSCMNVNGFDNLVDYFRNMLKYNENLDEALYWYNMFALVFTFIVKAEKIEKSLYL